MNEAREELREGIRQFYWFSRGHPKKKEQLNLETLTEHVADQILNLEGENWRIAIVEKKSELPVIANVVLVDFLEILRNEYPEAFAAGAHAYKDVMLKQGWVKEIKDGE